ncbi:hypothetical protein AVEN_9184-1 [Araneus ventricosus]|uniref:YqaJ viral recombinase domain-containing protein n=1 Tax=Araneus ventricosus TaxID=182803 RepID=A0A4Y2UDJ0_ARAVE|nr:hypothetical protein AVEN_9184-1 [Araneus ventricosus]
MAKVYSVHPNKPFLCSSPDGLIGDDGVLEIKCLYSGRFSTNLAEFITDGKYEFGLKISNKCEIYLPVNHKFHYQIQRQLFISNKKWCDLYVQCEKDAFILRIYRNEQCWANLLPKLEKLYLQCVLPEIIDGRSPRNLPIREPLLVKKCLKEKRKL